MTDPSRTHPDTALLARAVRVFEDAVELPEGDRAVYVERACDGDEALRQTVIELLQSHAEEDLAERTAALRPAALRPAALQSARRTGIEGTEFAGFRILDRAGMGGMGVVYRAEQADPRRIVALKVMRLDALGEEHAGRFRREISLLAQLQHPGIAQIHDTGSCTTEWGDMPWFAMEFVDGPPIDRFVAERRLPIAEVLLLMIQVCDAVQHAHARGVVHRDLKPQNVLVRELESGRLQPKILDFGIGAGPVGDATAAHVHTVTGQLLGTLGYMSPERTGGGTVDHRADVYSLGVMLFELLAGRQPFDLAGRSPVDAARMLALDQPTRLGRVDARFKGDLETIVDKALAREPDRRYPSAAALGEDLQRHLDNLPIRARPLSAWYFLRKSVRRHRGVVGGVTATMLALAIGLATALWLAGHNEALARNNQRLASREHAQRLAAVAAGDELRRALYRSEMRFVAGALVDPRGGDRARSLLDHWLPADETAAASDPRGFEWALARHMAFTTHSLVAGGRDGEILWDASGIHFAERDHWVTADATTGSASRRQRAFQSFPYVLRFAPLAGLIAAGVRDAVRVVRSGDEQLLFELPLENPNDLRIGPDGRYLAIAARPGGRDAMLVYDCVGRRFVREDLATTFGNRAFEFSPDGVRLADAVVPGQLRITVAPDFAATRIHALPAEPTFSLSWSRDAKRLAIGYRGGRIDLVDAVTGEVATQLTGHAGRVCATAWNGDGTRLLSVGGDSTVRVWNVADGTGRVLGNHHGEARRVAWSPDERLAASSGEDHVLRVFVVDRREAVRPLTDRDATTALGIAWHHDGRSVLVDHEAETLRLDPDSGEKERIAGTAARHSASGRLRCVVLDGAVEVHDGTTGSVVQRLPRWRRPLSRWHPRDDVLAIASDDAGIWLWRADTGERTQVDDRRQVHALAWHPDGSMLVGANGSYGNFQIDLAATPPRATEQPHPDDPVAWAQSPDGSLYALDEVNREVRLYAQGTTEVRHRLVGHVGACCAIAWNPAGTRIATGDDLGSVRLWDTATCEEVFTLQFDGPVTAIAWAPNGDRVVLLAGGRPFLLDGRSPDGALTPTLPPAPPTSPAAAK